MDNLRKRNRKRTLKKVVSILKLLILAAIVIGIPVAVYFLFPGLLKRFSTMAQVNGFLAQYKTASIFIYIGLQIFQIIVSIIPGQPIQFASGYMYSFWFGFLFSIIGIALGTVATFYLARFLGKDGMHIIFGEKRINKFVSMLNTKKAYIILFVLYLIPGFPKDLITYAAGISELKIKAYLILSLLGRSPALMATIMMGSMFRNGSYIGLIILAAVAVILFLTCFFSRNRLMALTDRLYDRLTRSSR